jgi:hypothetical protein
MERHRNLVRFCVTTIIVTAASVLAKAQAARYDTTDHLIAPQYLCSADDPKIDETLRASVPTEHQKEFLQQIQKFSDEHAMSYERPTNADGSGGHVITLSRDGMTIRLSNESAAEVYVASVAICGGQANDWQSQWRPFVQFIKGWNSKSI